MKQLLYYCKAHPIHCQNICVICKKENLMLIIVFIMIVFNEKVMCINFVYLRKGWQNAMDVVVV